MKRLEPNDVPLQKRVLDLTERIVDDLTAMGWLPITTDEERLHLLNLVYPTILFDARAGRLSSARIQSQGGTARAAKLTKAERSEIARKGAETRWKKHADALLVRNAEPPKRVIHGRKPRQRS